MQLRLTAPVGLTAHTLSSSTPLLQVTWLIRVSLDRPPEGFLGPPCQAVAERSGASYSFFAASLMSFLTGGGLTVALFEKDSRIGGTMTGMAIPTAPIMQLHIIIGSWCSIVLNHDALDIFDDNRVSHNGDRSWTPQR